MSLQRLGKLEASGGDSARADQVLGRPCGGRRPGWRPGEVGDLSEPTRAASDLRPAPSKQRPAMASTSLARWSTRTARSLPAAHHPRPAAQKAGLCTCQLSFAGRRAFSAQPLSPARPRTTGARSFASTPRYGERDKGGVRVSSPGPGWWRLMGWEGGKLS